MNHLSSVIKTVPSVTEKIDIVRTILPFDVIGPDMNMQANSILEGAIVLIAKNGYGGTGLRAIAKQCNVSLPKVYYYFPSKEHLLFAIIVRALYQLYFHARAVLAKPSVTGSPKLLDLIRTTLTYHMTRHAEFVVLYQDSNLLSDEFSIIADQFREDYLSLIASSLNQDNSDTLQTFKGSQKVKGGVKRLEYYLIGLMSWSLMNRSRVWGAMEDELAVNYMATELYEFFHKGMTGFLNDKGYQ